MTSAADAKPSSRGCLDLSLLTSDPPPEAAPGAVPLLPEAGSAFFNVPPSSKNKKSGSSGFVPLGGFI